MPDFDVQSAVLTSHRRVRQLLTLWRRVLLDSLPVDFVRLIEGKTRPCRITWNRHGFDLPEADLGPSVPFDVMVASELGLVVEFELPQEAEANLDAIVAHQIPVQTPFTADQVEWAAAVTQRRGRMLTIELVLCPKDLVMEVFKAAQELDGQLVSVQLDGAQATHQLLPATHRPTHETDRDIHVGRRLILANTLGFAVLIAIGLHSQIETVRYLGAEKDRLQAEAVVVREMRAQLNTHREELAFLEDTQAGSVTALYMLEVLAGVVHDGAWLDQLVITADKVELGGYADTSAQVLQSIDQSEQFANAVYRAPVRAQRGGGIERFSISADKRAEPPQGKVK